MVYYYFSAIHYYLMGSGQGGMKPLRGQALSRLLSSTEEGCCCAFGEHIACMMIVTCVFAFMLYNLTWTVVLTFSFLFLATKKSARHISFSSPYIFAGKSTPSEKTISLSLKLRIRCVQVKGRVPSDTKKGPKGIHFCTRANINESQNTR